MNDVVLAIYSDRLFMAAVGVYVLAMVLHAAEYATLRTARVPAKEARPGMSRICSPIGTSHFPGGSQSAPPKSPSVA